jgi:hypothetical protein
MSIFWVVAPCIPVGVYRRFGDVHRLHHQGDEYAARSLGNNLREHEVHTDLTASDACQVSDFDISGAEPSGFVTTVDHSQGHFNVQSSQTLRARSGS